MPEKTKMEIIEETIEVVESFGRSVDEGICVYKSSKNHPGCAVGRCMLPDKYDSDMESFSVDELCSLDNVPYQHLDELLIPAYRGHELSFWIDLQDFHDEEDNWNEDNSLSEEGKLELNQMKECYEN